MISAFRPTKLTPCSASYSASDAVASPAVVSLPTVSVIFSRPGHNDDIVEAAGHSHDADAQRRRAAGTGRLDLGRFDPAQPAVVRNQGGQMLLVQQRSAEHIAQKEGIGVSTPASSIAAEIAS